MYLFISPLQKLRSVFSSSNQQPGKPEITATMDRDRVGMWGNGDSVVPGNISGLDRMRLPGVNKVSNVFRSVLLRSTDYSCPASQKDNQLIKIYYYLFSYSDLLCLYQKLSFSARLCSPEIYYLNCLLETNIPSFHLPQLSVEKYFLFLLFSF